MSASSSAVITWRGFLTCQDSLLCSCDNSCRQGCNPPGELDCLFFDAPLWKHLVDKAQTLELIGRDRVTRQDEFHGLAGLVSQRIETGEGVGTYPILAQGSSKPLGPSTTGNGTDGYLWEPESGAFFGVNDITLATCAVSSGSGVTGTS